MFIIPSNQRMQFKTTLRFHLTPSRRKRPTEWLTANAAREVEERETLTHCGRTANCCSYCSVENPQKAKNKSPRGHSYATPWHVPKGLDRLATYLTILPTDACSAMLIAALVTTARKWDHPE